MDTACFLSIIIFGGLGLGLLIGYALTRKTGSWT